MLDISALPVRQRRAHPFICVRLARTVLSTPRSQCSAALAHTRTSKVSPHAKPALLATSAPTTIVLVCHHLLVVSALQATTALLEQSSQRSMPVLPARTAIKHSWRLRQSVTHALLVIIAAAQD